MSNGASIEAVSSARAVLFDLDGVLVDSSPVIDRVWRIWAERRPGGGAIFSFTLPLEAAPEVPTEPA